MKRQAWNRLANLLAAITIAGVTATWAVAQVRHGRAARSDKPAAERIASKMTTVCPSRFELNDVHTFWWEVDGTEDDVRVPHSSFNH